MAAKHIAIIPARAGSKSIRDKNLIKFNHKTLVNIVAEKALNTKIFQCVYLSSDYLKKNLGVDDVSSSSLSRLEYVKRPAELATDDAKMIDVVKHVMKVAGDYYKYVWILQPTSPFAPIEDFAKVKQMIESGNYESVISFKPVKEYSNRMYTLKENDNVLKAFPLNSRVSYNNKQDLDPVYIRSGNFYVTTKENIINNNSLESKPVGPFIMNRERGINIDDHEDLVMARYYHASGAVKI